MINKTKIEMENLEEKDYEFYLTDEEIKVLSVEDRQKYQRAIRLKDHDYDGDWEKDGNISDRLLLEIGYTQQRVHKFGFEWKKPYIYKPSNKSKLRQRVELLFKGIVQAFK